jgi:hypothetical protein
MNSVIERRRLIGVSEIAVLLGVSKQRASILSSRKGFPDPMEHVIPVDDDTQKALVELYMRRPGDQSFSAEGTWKLFSERAFLLPEAPRLWRQSAVEEWAKENGRDLPQKSRRDD